LNDASSKPIENVRTASDDSSAANALSAQDRSAYEQAMADALDLDRDGVKVIARGLTLGASGTA